MSIDPEKLERAELIAEIHKLRALVKDGEAVVNDFMPNIGHCALQDIGRLNQFLMEANNIET